MQFSSFSPCAIPEVLNPQMKDRAVQTVRYDCTKCDSRFTSKVYLHQHEQDHQKSFYCPFGGCALFSNKADYQKHVKSHNEKRYLPCSQCNKSFTDVRDYAKHVKEHTEKPMTSCQFCSAKFIHVSEFRKHMISHSVKKFVHFFAKNVSTEREKETMENRQMDFEKSISSRSTDAECRPMIQKSIHAKKRNSTSGMSNCLSTGTASREVNKEGRIIEDCQPSESNTSASSANVVKRTFQDKKVKPCTRTVSSNSSKVAQSSGNVKSVEKEKKLLRKSISRQFRTARNRNVANHLKRLPQNNTELNEAATNSLLKRRRSVRLNAGMH